MIYYIVCGILILFTIADGLKHSPKSSQFTSVFTAVILILFAGLRYETGTDWFSYTDFYKYGGENIEPGYMLFNDLFRKSNIHYNLFLIFINTVSLSLVFFAFRKHAKLVGIAFLLYFCELYLYFNFSGMRQGLAISITLFSFTYAIDRKFLNFTICILIASTFHITSLIFFLAYFIPKGRMKLYHYVLLAIFFLSISSAIYALLNFVSGSLGDKLKFYAELDTHSENIQSLFVVGIIKRSLILLVLLIFGKPFFKVENNIYYVNIYLFGFGIYLSTYLISPDMGVRLGSYFLIFDTIIVGRLVFANYEILRRISIICLFSIIALYKIYTYVNMDTYKYHSIFKLNE
jgi:hypothetical protein